MYKGHAVLVGTMIELPCVGSPLRVASVISLVQVGHLTLLTHLIYFIILYSILIYIKSLIML